MSFTYKQTGVQATIDRLLAFDKKFKKSAMLKIGRAGVKPLKAAMKKNAPTDSKSWKDSLDSKIKVFGEGTVLFFVVGPASKYATVVVVKAKFFIDKQKRLRRIPAAKVGSQYAQQRRRPVNYSHLIENGFHHAASNPGAVDAVYHQLVAREGEARGNATRRRAKSIVRDAQVQHMPPGGYHMIAKSEAESRAASAAAMEAVAGSIMETI